MCCRVPCGRPGVAGVVQCGPRRVKIRNIRHAECPGHRRVDGEPASSEAAGGGTGRALTPGPGLGCSGRLDGLALGARFPGQKAAQGHGEELSRQSPKEAVWPEAGSAWQGGRAVPHP